MKTSITICSIIFITICSSCHNKRVENQNTRVIGSVPVTDTISSNLFAHVQFASKYDTSCGMPLAAGLEDTVHYKNKIYGFCSKECKDEFVATLKKDQEDK